MLTQITEQLLNGRTEKKKIYNYMRGHISTQCNKDLCYCAFPEIFYKNKRLKEMKKNELLECSYHLAHMISSLGRTEQKTQEAIHRQNVKDHIKDNELHKIDEEMAREYLKESVEMINNYSNVPKPSLYSRLKAWWSKFRNILEP